MVHDVLPKGCYVVLHIDHGSSQFRDGDTELVAAHGQRFELSEDTWIERLDEEWAKNVLEACEPPDYRIKRARQDRHLYAFVKRVPDIEQKNYEGSEALHAIVSLSRLIHPTSTGDRYIAKSSITAWRNRPFSPSDLGAQVLMSFLARHSETGCRSKMQRYFAG